MSTYVFGAINFLVLPPEGEKCSSYIWGRKHVFSNFFSQKEQSYSASMKWWTNMSCAVGWRLNSEAVLLDIAMAGMTPKRDSKFQWLMSHLYIDVCTI